MSKALVTKQQQNHLAIEQAIIQGDLAGLNTEQRLQYVKTVCKSVKLNPLTRPFDYIKFEGKTILYLNRGGAEQLRKIHNISIKNLSRDLSKERELYTVIVKAINPKGREEDGMGVVSLGGLRGKELANAIMRAETKAKRRATLAICGLSNFDSPTGEDDPVQDTQIQERIEQVTEQAQIESKNVETEAVVEATVDKNAEGDLPPAPPAPPLPEDYIMRAGKNKGQFLKDLSESKLKRWMDWYTAAREAGKPMHPDVQDDAFHITARLQELKIEHEQLELERIKSDG